MVSGQSFTQNLNQKGIKDLDLRLRASVRSKRHTPGPSQEGSVARRFFHWLINISALRFGGGKDTPPAPLKRGVWLGDFSIG